MRQHIALVSRNEDQRRHGRRQAHADGPDGATDGLHGVVERKAAVHAAPRAVNIHHDFGVRVLAFQITQFPDQGIYGLVVDLTDKLNFPVGQHFILDSDKVVAVGCFFDDVRSVVHSHSPFQVCTA